VQDDLIVIGGDTLFLEDFSLASVLGDFCAAHRRGAAEEDPACMLLAYTTDDAGAAKFGILEVDETGKATAFLEKPGPARTKSRLACPCFYLLSAQALPVLAEFLEEKKDQPLKERDAPGNFIRYLTERVSTRVRADLQTVSFSSSFHKCLPPCFRRFPALSPASPGASTSAGSTRTLSATRRFSGPRGGTCEACERNSISRSFTA
jgi:hypothetical protein